MNHSRKVLLIGWDAADWKVIHRLMDEGKMPNVQKLVKNGVMGNMATLFPSLSPMLWTTIATGKRPYKHGIYGFSEPTPDGKAIQPMTNLSRKCKAIWNILNQHDKKSIVVGWWPSNPAEPINGAMVSDFFHKAPRRPGDPWAVPRNCVHPQELLEQLIPMRVHPTHLKPQHMLPFVPLAPELDQDTDGRLSAVMKVVCECVTIHRAAAYLLQTQEWDFAAVYYDAIDHFCHGFMKYHPPQQDRISDNDFRMFNNVVTQGYIYHDEILGKLLEIAGENVNVILMSDHGFHSDHLRPKSIPTEPAGPAIEHRDYGIFVAAGPDIKKDEIIHGAGLCDITPTILTMYGLPVGEDMDGRALVELFEETPEVDFINSWEDVPGDDGQHPTDLQMTASDSKEALEQLIALGYIERPDQDSDVAIKKTQRELDYNLARAFMDGGLYGEAIPLLTNLYNDFPLEFRFGLQLSNCLKAMGRTGELDMLVSDLENRWGVAAIEAKKKIREVAKLARERRKHWRELKKIDEQNKESGNQDGRLARTTPDGRPILFSEAERTDIRKIRSIARGNPQTLDFLAATIAASNGDFETALEKLEKAEQTKFKDPHFLFQLGNVYLGLKRVDDAIRSFSKALDIDQFHPNALMGLSRAYLENGELATSKDFGRQAIGLKFHFPLAHFYLANALSQLGETDAAIRSYNTALEQNPNFREAHLHLAKIYRTSAIDEALANSHQNAVATLDEGQTQYDEAIQPIELKPAEDLDFSEILPTVGATGNTSFLRCIGQAKPADPEDLEALPKPQADIVVVTGLPRSGTSMMMQMMVAGGIEAYSDGRRHADESNPKGYFESQDVKKISSENAWMFDCEGKVVKIVAPLIPYLPQGFQYHVVMMIRDIGEILESQEKMLERLDRPGGDLGKDRFELIFKQQLDHCRNLFKLHKVPHIEVGYKDAIADPDSTVAKVCKFLPIELDQAKMREIVDPALYRQRK